MRIYSVFDKVAEEFGPVFQQPNDQAAKRAFKAQVVNVPYCTDLDLYFICEFNEKDRFFTDSESNVIDRGSAYEDEYKKLHPIRFVNEKTNKEVKENE